MKWKELFNRALACHVAAIGDIQNHLQSLIDIYELISKTYTDNHRLYIAGNGGSAADAQHIAAELVGRFKRDRKGLSATALTTDTSCLTAIGNDYSFENIFTRQIETHLIQGDLLWLLSVSGSSSNILSAAKAAKQKGASVVLFTSKRCSVEFVDMCDASFVVNTTSSDVVQECHQFVYHLLCDWVESDLTEPT